MSWGYRKENGPDHWFEDFPVAKAGCRQSPVDINTKSAAKAEADGDKTESGAVGRRDSTDASVGHGGGQCRKLEISYDPSKIVDIENTGASWKVNANSEGSSLKGGPLEADEYALWQFHAHWGNDDTKGSEHTIDGKRFAAELHLVHWNKTKYSSPEEACSKSDGLAVLGMLLKEDSDSEGHPELQKVVAQLPSIRYKGQRSTFPSEVDPAKLLPASRAFWTYPGSLTTPPLLESVTWIVFKEPLRVSKEQLEAMRKLVTVSEDEAKSEVREEDLMVNNFRPPVPMGDRQLREM